MSARWVVIRRCANEGHAKVFGCMAKNIPWDRRRAVTPDTPDAVSQNREDPDKHPFETLLGWEWLWLIGEQTR